MPIMKHKYIKTYTKYYISCEKCGLYCSSTDIGFGEDSYEFDSEEDAVKEFECCPKSEDLLSLIDKNKDIGFIGAVNEDGVLYCIDCWCEKHNLSRHTKMCELCEEQYLVSK